MITTDSIIESNMTFGPYPEGKCFYIEKWGYYQKKIQQNNSTVEFILLKKYKQHESLAFVEAKSSAPKDRTELLSYCKKIRRKFHTSLDLFLSASRGMHGKEQQKAFSQDFVQLDFSKTSIHFVLIIKGFKKEWALPLNNMLNRELKDLLRLFGPGNTLVKVLTEDMARKYRYITD